MQQNMSESGQFYTIEITMCKNMKVFSGPCLFKIRSAFQTCHWTTKDLLFDVVSAAGVCHCTGCVFEIPAEPFLALNA